MMNCPICLEADDGTLTFAALKCGHVFHRDCISSWLATSKSTKFCPVCRKSADSFLNLYLFSSPTRAGECSAKHKPMKRKQPRERKKKKFSTQQQSIHHYELRSNYSSRKNGPYWLRLRLS